MRPSAPAIQIDTTEPSRVLLFLKDHYGWAIALVSTVFTFGVGWQRFQEHDRRITSVEIENKEISKAIGEISGDVRVIRALMESKEKKTP